jgi:hypothetical protein
LGDELTRAQTRLVDQFTDCDFPLKFGNRKLVGIAGAKAIPLFRREITSCRIF